MIIAKNVPIFLWEYAIVHAMYLRNCVYHKSLNKTPYKITHNEKPNISHLCEFDSLVWILLQGQNKPAKLQPRSKAQLFVGYDNSSKSVFHFLNLSEHETPPERWVTPTVLHEGEIGSKEGMQNDQDDPVIINNKNKCVIEQDKPNGEEPLKN